MTVNTKTLFVSILFVIITDIQHGLCYDLYLYTLYMSCKFA